MLEAQTMEKEGGDLQGITGTKEHSGGVGYVIYRCSDHNRLPVTKNKGKKQAVALVA